MTATRIDNCDNCGSPLTLRFIDANDFDTGKQTFNLKQCPKCTLVQISPILNDTQLSKYYSNEYYGSGSKKFSKYIEKWTIYSNKRLAKSILRTFNKVRRPKNDPAKILDIGCGRGNLLKAFSKMAFECHGIERTEFPDEPSNADINIHKTSLREAGFSDNYFDIVVIWHVLEHLSHPSDTLQEVSRILRPSGILVVAVPNIGSFQARLYGKNWFHLDLPRHIYHFNKTSLNYLLAKYGFKTIVMDTRAIDQSVFGFIQSGINFSTGFSPNSFYEQLKLPWKNRRPVFYIQAAIAVLLLPLSLIDFFVSAVARRGCCLAATAIKQPADTE